MNDLQEKIKKAEEERENLRGQIRTLEKCPICKGKFKEIIGIGLFCFEHNTRPKKYYISINYNKKNYRIFYDQNNISLRSYDHIFRLLRLINTDFENFLEYFQLTQSKNNKMRNGIGYIYVINIEDFDYYKIGKSIALDNRLKTHHQLPFKIKNIFHAKVKQYNHVERILIKKFKHKKIKGEWFTLDDKDIDNLKETINLYKIK